MDKILKCSCSLSSKRITPQEYIDANGVNYIDVEGKLKCPNCIYSKGSICVFTDSYEGMLTLLPLIDNKETFKTCLEALKLRLYIAYECKIALHNLKGEATSRIENEYLASPKSKQLLEDDIKKALYLYQQAYMDCIDTAEELTPSAFMLNMIKDFIYRHLNRSVS